MWYSRTSSSGWSNGSGRKSTVLTRLKMAVLAAMPIARTTITEAANAGARHNMRTARRKSVSNGVIEEALWVERAEDAGVRVPMRGAIVARMDCRQYQRRAAGGDAAARF
jgi:hypothetical protein